MRRVAASAVFGGLIVACASFDAGSAPQSQSPIDGGTDTTADGSTSAPSFCAAQTGAIFCDDFEQSGRTLAAPAPWTAFRRSAEDGMTLAPGFDSPHALHIAAELSSGEQRQLLVTLPQAERKVRAKFRAFLGDAVRIDPPSDDQMQATVIGVAFDDGHYVDYVVFDFGAARPGGYALSDLRGGGGEEDIAWFEAPPIGLRSKEWLDLTLEIEREAAELVLRLKVDGEVLSDNSYPGVTSPALVLGPRSTGVRAAFDIAYDNVLVTTY